MIMKDPAKMDCKESEKALAQLRSYENKFGCEAAVVKIQNLHLGSSYVIMPVNDAAEGMKDCGGPEIYLKMFTKDYFSKKSHPDT